MPLSRRMARLNKRVTNRIIGQFAAWLPGFAVLEHVGRTTGARYAIPMIVFRTAGGYRLALTCGPQTDRVRNVLAAGGGVLRVRGRRLACRDPRIEADPDNRWAPWFVRQIIGRAGVTQYLDLTVEPGGPG